MIERSGGSIAEAAFLRSLRSPRYVIEAPTSDDLRRAAELVERYADLRLGGTDASVIALADSVTAPFSRWTVATSLSFSHPPPQASPFFRRELRVAVASNLAVRARAEPRALMTENDLNG